MLFSTYGTLRWLLDSGSQEKWTVVTCRKATNFPITLDKLCILVKHVERVSVVMVITTDI